MRVIEVSQREMDALNHLVYDGADNQTIARRMGVKYNTAKTYMRQLLIKSEMPNRAALALAVVRDQIAVSVREPRYYPENLPSCRPRPDTASEKDHAVLCDTPV